MTVDGTPFLLESCALFPISVNHWPRSFVWPTSVLLPQSSAPLSQAALEKQHSWNKWKTVSRFLMHSAAESHWLSPDLQTRSSPYPILKHEPSEELAFWWRLRPLGILGCGRWGHSDELKFRSILPCIVHPKRATKWFCPPPSVPTQPPAGVPIRTQILRSGLLSARDPHLLSICHLWGLPS